MQLISTGHTDSESVVTRIHPKVDRHTLHMDCTKAFNPLDLSSGGRKEGEGGGRRGRRRGRGGGEGGKREERGEDLEAAPQMGLKTYIPI